MLRSMTLVSAAAVLCLGMLPALSAQADEFSVQIGAFKESPTDFTRKAERIGTLHETTKADGVTRIQIGRYASRQEATVALGALRGAGYADAFVVKKGDGVVTAGATPRAGAPARSNDPLESVPAALRDRVVLLDGRLHVKEGDRFIALDAYRRQSE